MMLSRNADDYPRSRAVNARFLVRVAAQGAQEPLRRAMHETLRVGRARDGNDVSFPGDVTLSGRHGEFFYRDNAWHVRDLETESGTFVNDERVLESVLVGGARVRMGIAEIIYTPEVEISVVPDALEPAGASRLRPPVEVAESPILDEDGIPRFKIRPPAEDLADDVPAIRLAGSGRRAKIREIE